MATVIAATASPACQLVAPFGDFVDASGQGGGEPAAGAGAGGSGGNVAAGGATAGGSGGSAGASGANAGSGGAGAGKGTGGGGAAGASGGSGASGASGSCSSGEKACPTGCVATTDPKSGCGAVGCAPCSLAHATAGCSPSGACSVATCDPGYQDCDGNATNGCESHAADDVAHCGSCGNACALPNATALCASGKCGVASCDPGYADCDADPSNGCEARLATDPNDCNTCGHVCPGQTGKTPTCTGGVCGLSDCAPPFQDCKNDGTCQTDTSSDVDNCGACGAACALPNAQVACTSGACTLTTCVSPHANCDGNPANGCEVDTTSSVAHCGSCANDCTALGKPNVQTYGCAGSTCTVASCIGGFGDCDGDVSNGCETMLSSDADCGACGHACTNGSTCVNGACSCVAGNAEDCTNGVDDNCDGLVDCADPMCTGAGFACTSLPSGGGWTIVLFDATGRPACPSPFTGATDVSSNWSSPALQCACNCGTSTPAQCKGAATVNSGSSCASHYADYTFTTSAPCTNAGGTQNFQTGQVYDPVSITMSVLAGTCTQTDVKTSVPMPTADLGETCGAPVGAGCGAGTCAPAVPTGFQLCSMHASPATCPAGTKTVTVNVGDTYADQRSCTGCTCHTGQLTCTANGVNFWSDASCTQAPIFFAENACTGVGSNTGSRSYVTLASFSQSGDASCHPATTSASTGTVVPSGAGLVLCCL